MLAHKFKMKKYNIYTFKTSPVLIDPKILDNPFVYVCLQNYNSLSYKEKINASRFIQILNFDQQGQRRNDDIQTHL